MMLGSTSSGAVPAQMTQLQVAAEVRERLVDLLNRRLADAVDLYTQTQQAHWNVRDARGRELHDLFEQLAARAQAHADLLAEHVKALGGIALGTARIAARASRMPEYPLLPITAQQHLEALAERVAQYGESLRTAMIRARDMRAPATEELCGDLAGDAGMQLWMLEAHLQDMASYS